MGLLLIGTGMRNSRDCRIAMSMARLWRDQGNRNEARELLAPVYGCSPKGLTRAI
jgi:hypothetical protein